MRLIQEALTFDDVLLEPAYSDVLPRDVSLATRLTRDIDLQLPIMSAAMDTVTEARLAIALAQDATEPALLGEALGNLAGIYTGQGQLDEALETYRRALSIYQELEAQPDIGKTLNQVGEIHEQLGDYPQALESFQAALVALQEAGDEEGQEAARQNIESVQAKLTETGNGEPEIEGNAEPEIEGSAEELMPPN